MGLSLKGLLLSIRFEFQHFETKSIKDILLYKEQHYASRHNPIPAKNP